ncbi:hypothetical protein H4R35_004831 [Dimargaris xerosporica]|nr:hypothetical protein H4R35_004831 [Dimargaris xerosporica]
MLSTQDDPHGVTDSGEPKLMKACDLCRRKKIKCDGEKPECSTCRKNQAECHYSAWVRTKRTRKSQADTSGSSSGSGPRMEPNGMMNTFTFQTTPYVQPSAHPPAAMPPTPQTSTFAGSQPPSAPFHQTHFAANTPAAPSGAEDSNNSINELLQRIQNLEQHLQSMVSRSNLAPAAGSNGGGPVTHGAAFNPGHPAASSYAIPTGAPSQLLAMPMGSMGVRSTMAMGGGGNNPTNANNKRRYAGSSDSPGQEHEGSIGSHAPKLRIVAGPSLNTPNDTEMYYEPGLVNRLIELFFRTKHPFLSVFSYDVFMKRWKAGQIRNIFLNTILAITCRHSSEPLVKRDPPYLSGEMYFEKAKALAVSAMSAATLENIQAFILLGLYEIGRGKETAWMYIGIATRMAQRMGLNRIDTNPNRSHSSKEWMQRETKRRVWWLTFITENLASLAMSRPPSLHPDDCKVHHPSDEQDIKEFTSPTDESTTESLGSRGSSSFAPDPSSMGHQQPSGASPANANVDADEVVVMNAGIRANLPSMNLTSYDVELSIIISKISILRSRVLINPNKWLPGSEALTQELMTWFSKLPPHLQIPPGQRWSAQHVQKQPAYCSYLINLHSLYYTGVIFANRVDEYLLSQLTLNETVLSHAQEFCWNSAEAISQLMDLSEHLHIQYYNCFFGICLINAGFIFIENMVAPTDKPFMRPDRQRVEKATDYLIQIVHILRDIGRYWAQNEMCTKVFRKMLHEKFPSLPDTEDWAKFLSALKPAALEAFDRAYPNYRSEMARALGTVPSPSSMPSTQALDNTAMFTTEAMGQDGTTIPPGAMLNLPPEYLQQLLQGMALPTGQLPFGTDPGHAALLHNGSLKALSFSSPTEGANDGGASSSGGDPPRPTGSADLNPALPAHGRISAPQRTAASGSVPATSTAMATVSAQRKPNQFSAQRPTAAPTMPIASVQMPPASQANVALSLPMSSVSMPPQSMMASMGGLYHPSGSMPHALTDMSVSPLATSMAFTTSPSHSRHASESVSNQASGEPTRTMDYTQQQVPPQRHQAPLSPQLPQSVPAGFLPMSQQMSGQIPQAFFASLGLTGQPAAPNADGSVSMNKTTNGGVANSPSDLSASKSSAPEGMMNPASGMPGGDALTHLFSPQYYALLQQQQARPPPHMPVPMTGSHPHPQFAINPTGFPAPPSSNGSGATNALPNSGAPSRPTNPADAANQHQGGAAGVPCMPVMTPHGLVHPSMAQQYTMFQLQQQQQPHPPQMMYANALGGFNPVMAMEGMSAMNVGPAGHQPQGPPQSTAAPGNAPHNGVQNNPNQMTSSGYDPNMLHNYSIGQQSVQQPRYMM